MKTWVKVAPVLCAAVILVAGACVPPPSGGGGGTPNLNPIAVASAQPTSGNAPLPVSFDGTGSTDPDGTIVSYAWNFGNGNSATGPTASTVYSQPGVFTAVLTVTDNGGRTATSSVSITVIGDADGDGFFPPADCNDNDPTIFPGAPDPAGDGIDQNCDGIDGVVDDAVFVNSATGSTTGTCGTITEPCATIDLAQTRAVATSKSAVYVAGGTYSKFNVVAGLEIRGGYGQNWQRGVAATSPVTANVVASLDSSLGGPVGILADGINEATTVADLRVTGVAAGVGQTSYGVFVRDSTDALRLEALTIIGGVGGTGLNGGAGQGGWFAAAGSGSNGGNGFEPGGCNTTAAGAGGSGGTGAAVGGAGGRGGAIDGSCFLGVCTSCDARPGSVGVTGAGFGGGAGGAGGPAGTSGIPGVCNLQGNRATDGSNGSPGAAGAPGASGPGGAAGQPGATGGLGVNGAGGGGGGGGGGADCGVDDAGAGGGGGGAGGARATAGGVGGGAGAASVALRLVNASPQLVGVQITLGTGGTGGTGGAGAPGQPGGAGGQGGAAFERGGAGGNGGNGGTGGASAGGGGGGGGAAVGLSRTASSAPTGTPSFTGGTAGAGGAGGAAAPGGTGGNTGQAGQVLNTFIG